MVKGKEIVVLAKPQPTKQVVMVESKAQSKKKRKKKNKKSKKKASKANRVNLRRLFQEYMIAPDIYGPFRQPRWGGSQRTGLGYDITEYTFTGSSMNVVQGIQAGSSFNGGAIAGTFAVANSGTALGAATSQTTPGAQFPAVSQLADVNMTACSFVAYYTGNMLNVGGEILLGSTIPIISTATYSSLFYYPGTVKIPIAKLLQEPVRVNFRKLSEAADEFNPPANNIPDVDLPFVFTNGLPAGQTLNIIMYRSWEYRSTTAAGSVVPYERVGDSHSAESNAYQDARADTALMPAPVTPVEAEGGWFNYSTLFGYATPYLASVGVNAAAAGLGLMNSHMTRLRNGDVRSPHGRVTIEEIV